MKRNVLTLLLMVITMLSFSQAQPQMKISASNKTPVENPFLSPTDDPVLPGDDLLWSQALDCAGGLTSSEIISQLGLVTNSADDFEFTAGKSITGARWWFGVFSGDYAPFSYWTITIFDDASCSPGNMLQQWTIPFNQSHELLACNVYWPDYSYWATLSPAFNAMPNTKYWISIQAGDHVFPGQWGWSVDLTTSGCSGALQSDFFGFNEYTPLNLDFSFELYGTPYDVPMETPVSNWALFIGLGLILAVAVIRFRRIL